MTGGLMNPTSLRTKASSLALRNLAYAPSRLYSPVFNYENGAPTNLLVVLVFLDVKGGEVEEPEAGRLLQPSEAMWYCQVERADARTGVVERRERREHVLKRCKGL